MILLSRSIRDFAVSGFRLTAVLAFVGLAEGAVFAQATPLFEDEVLCQGTGVEVRRSRLDRAVQQFQANATARGQRLDPAQMGDIESRILDRLVITQLLLGKATDEDRAQGQALADKFIAESQAQAGSEAAFRRQLLVMTFTEQEFATQVVEQAVCEQVIDRILRPQVQISDADIEVYYQTHTNEFTRPERVRVRHVLFSIRDPVTGAELPEPQRLEKRALAQQVLGRARNGEDFTELIRQFSDDVSDGERVGEYLIARGQMVPEFEGAAFSLQPGQISDLVTTRFGYHIILMVERVPSDTLPLAEVRNRLRNTLERLEIQEKRLPEFLRQMRQAAKLQYLNGATPPTDSPPLEAPAEPEEP